MKIRDWVEATFGGPEPKVLLDLGCNNGSDTLWLAALPGATVWAVDADPRNCPPLKDRVGHLQNVQTFCPLAIAGHDGVAELTMSDSYHDRPGWTESSSICRPTGHLTSLPHISFFPQVVKVNCKTLDSFAAQHGIGDVSLIWSDLQGAEPQLIAGGRQTLSRTRYLYAEVPPTEEYSGQLPLNALMKLLPGVWSVIHRWPSDVLLERQG